MGSEKSAAELAIQSSLIRSAGSFNKVGILLLYGIFKS